MIAGPGCGGETEFVAPPHLENGYEPAWGLCRREPGDVPGVFPPFPEERVIREPEGGFFHDGVGWWLLDVPNDVEELQDYEESPRGIDSTFPSVIRDPLEQVVHGVVALAHGDDG